MFDMMNQAKNAIEVYNSALSIYNSNIANMSVAGYKRLDISFQSILSSIMSSGTPASTFSNIGGTNPIQAGQGVGIGSISVDFSQGNPLSSTNPLDMSITGSGLFILSDDNGSTYQYTRAGKFIVSNAGNLTTDTGMQVYGLSAGGALTPITALAGTSADYTWNDGTGELLYQGNSTGYRIALTSFNNPGGLMQASGTTFRESLASGTPSTPTSTGGLSGTVTSGQVEQSNVFYASESINSLEIQRAISANLNSVKIASDMIASFISKLG